MCEGLCTSDAECVSHTVKLCDPKITLNTSEHKCSSFTPEGDVRAQRIAHKMRTNHSVQETLTSHTYVL